MRDSWSVWPRSPSLRCEPPQSPRRRAAPHPPHRSILARRAIGQARAQRDRIEHPRPCQEAGANQRDHRTSAVLTMIGTPSYPAAQNSPIELFKQLDRSCRQKCRRIRQSIFEARTLDRREFTSRTAHFASHQKADSNLISQPSPSLKRLYPQCTVAISSRELCFKLREQQQIFFSPNLKRISDAWPMHDARATMRAAHQSQRSSSAPRFAKNVLLLDHMEPLVE